MKTAHALLIAFGGAALLGARGKPPATFRLVFPVACRVNVDCAVQNYLDADPGPAAHDYMCHGRTYDGHNGVDIRIGSEALMRAGVGVRAAAAGRVLRVRDGVPDVSIRAAGAPDVKGEECGNGLVIDDGGGWETQYCHLKRGSIRVRPGRRVRAGAPLGQVGLSGDTEFPHLHLTVRKDGRVVDPFAYGAAPGSCGGGVPLWKDRIAYQSGQVFVAGFATRVPTMAEAQRDGADQRPLPTRTGPALVAFVQAIGLSEGDLQQITITGPDMRTVVDSKAAPLDHDKAQWIIGVGRKTPAGGWQPGIYQARYAVRRGGVEPIVRTFRIRL